MPGALSRIYNAGLWERSKGCRYATTPVVPADLCTVESNSANARWEEQCKANAPCRFPTTQGPSQRSPHGMVLRASDKNTDLGYRVVLVQQVAYARFAPFSTLLRRQERFTTKSLFNTGGPACVNIP